ncbi:MAG: hypothetical protein AAGE43_08275 [Pseudomonadota bacterium]
MSVSFLAENKAMQTIRARVAFHSRQHGFDKRMLDLTSPGSSITPTLLAELYAYWGDPLSPANEQFLRSCVAEVTKAEGPVLLSGASLMTLILGAICTQNPEKSKQLWCLENEPHWANLMRSWLTEYRVSGAHVIQSPARLYGDHVWYSVATDRLPKSFPLVICEGNGATPRGVVGIVERLSERLHPAFTILARNVKEASVLKRLKLWASEHEAKIALIDKQAGFVKLTRQINGSVPGTDALPEAQVTAHQTPSGKPAPKRPKKSRPTD